MFRGSFPSVLLWITFFTTSLSAQSNLKLEPIADGFVIPVDIKHANDERLFVVEKIGTIRIIDEDGAVLGTPFLDVSDRAISSSSERGLLGMAFDPDYANNGYFYINYTEEEGTSIISRFKRSENGPNVADPNSEKIILTIDQPFNNHNAGDLAFGPDGYFYIPMGDGGSSGDPRNFSQNPQSLLGKILRIDVNTQDDDSVAYKIPVDNPFVDDPNTLDEIWSMGLRNPWRISFDRQSGDLWIGDVGQFAWEEINYQPANSTGGENYGWRCYEGMAEYNTEDCPGFDSFIEPVYVYAHGTGGCGGSVITGSVYWGEVIGSLRGKFIYTDYCTGMISSLTPNQFGGGFIQEDLLLYTNNEISTMREGADGELYVATTRASTIFKLTQETTTSTEEIKGLTTLTASPNPFNDRINLQVSFDEATPFEWELLNLNGQLLNKGKQSAVKAANMEIETSELDSGIYFLKLITESGTKTFKLVK